MRRKPVGRVKKKDPRVAGLLREELRGADDRSLFAQWALDVAARGGIAHVARVQGGELRAFQVADLVGSVAPGPEVFLGVTRVLARTAQDGGWVGFVARMLTSVRTGPPPRGRTVGCFAQCVRDASLGLLLEIFDEAGTRTFNCIPLSLSDAEQFGDFFADEPVDPALEAALLAKGFPGARAPDRPLVALAPASNPSSVRPTQAVLAEGERRRAELRATLRLEAAAASPEAMEGLGLPHELFLPRVPVVVHHRGGLADALERLARPPSRQLLFAGALQVAVLGQGEELHPALAASTDRDVRAVGLSVLAHQRLRVFDVSGLERAAHRLHEDLLAPLGPEPDWRALLVAWVPERATPNEEAHLVRPSLVATALAQRLLVALVREDEELPSADWAQKEPSRAALQRYAEALLERAGVHPSAPLRTAFRALGGRHPENGDAWYDDLRERLAKGPVSGEAAELGQIQREVLVYLAARAATLLGLTEMGEAELGSPAALAADPTGLLHPARELLVRGLIRGAAALGGAPSRREADPEAWAWAARLLARARELSPGNTLALGCHNEARFALGARAEIAADLEEEVRARPRSLGAAAEALACAQALGDRAAIRRACDAVLARARGTPHAWIAEARVLLARPTAATLTRVTEALASTPEAPETSDRGGAALWGQAPERWAGDLLALARALDEATREAPDAVPVDEPPPGPASRPDDAPEQTVRAARRALRRWLDKPKLARAEQKHALEEHLRRAAFLADDDAPPGWLDAARSLAAALELFTRAPDGHDAAARDLVAETLREADAALEGAVARAWGPRVEAQLRVAALRSREAAALQAAAAEARTAGERDALDGRLGALLAEGTDDGGMRLAPDALARSARELGTPAWAITEGLRQVRMFELSGGRRDQKALKGTRDARGALWELRSHGRALPVRVLFRRTAEGPEVVAIFAKEDDEQQQRVIDRVRAWSRYSGAS